MYVKELLVRRYFSNVTPTHQTPLSNNRLTFPPWSSCSNSPVTRFQSQLGGCYKQRVSMVGDPFHDIVMVNQSDPVSGKKKDFLWMLF